VGGWRKLHNEELRILHNSQNIIRVIRSRRMRWIGHVALMGEIKMLQILIGKPEGIERSEYLRIDGYLILERILGK
jgi:hypothetical protein